MNKLNYDLLIKLVGLFLTAGLCLFTIYVNKGMDLQNTIISSLQSENLDTRHFCNEIVEKITNNNLKISELNGKFEGHILICEKLLNVISEEIDSLKKPR